MAAPQSEAFRRWFGQSVVRNADGSPMVVFHTTKATNVFDTFRLPEKEVGVHFGTLTQARRVTGKHVYKVYLSLQRPLRTVDLFEWTGVRIAWELVRQRIIGREDPVARRINALDEAAHSGKAPFDESMVESNRLGRSLLAALGYDGIVYRNRFESDDPEDEDYDYDPGDPSLDLYAGGAGDSYVILDPRQVKSATDNIGAFDP